MRNASDIFCLKELKDGDTSGTQMFSVNGQCHLTKMSRRKNLHLHTGSSSFEYGSSAVPQKPPPLEMPTEVEGELANKYYDGTAEDDNLGEIKDDMEELRLYEQEQGNPFVIRSDAIAYDDDDVSAPDKVSPDEKKKPSPKGSPKKKKSPVLRKLTVPRQEEKVSESAMTRNPLTGAGVETETHRKPKKGPSKHSKLMW